MTLIDLLYNAALGYIAIVALCVYLEGARLIYRHVRYHRFRRFLAAKAR